MANNTTKLIIDVTSRGIRSVQTALGSLSRTMWGMARFSFSKIFSLPALIGFGAGLTGVVVGIKRVVAAYMEQQDAEQMLAAAIRNHGGEVDVLIPKYKAFAASIQAQTKYGDESIITNMAYLRNLGVVESQLEDAARAAVGLAAAYRIDLSTAMMLVGRASQGQTQMLTRYGIKLADGMTDQQKFNALLKIGAGNYKLAEKEAATLSGRMMQMKNAFGDMLEVIGNHVIKILRLEDVFNRLKTTFENWSKTIESNESVNKWAGKAEKAVAAIKKSIQGLFAGGKQRGEAIKFLVDAGKLAGLTFLSIVESGASAIGSAIANAFRDKMPESIKKLWGITSAPIRAVGAAAGAVSAVVDGATIGDAIKGAFGAGEGQVTASSSTSIFQDQIDAIKASMSEYASTITGAAKDQRDTQQEIYSRVFQYGKAQGFGMEGISNMFRSAMQQADPSAWVAKYEQKLKDRAKSDAGGGTVAAIAKSTSALSEQQYWDRMQGYFSLEKDTQLEELKTQTAILEDIRDGSGGIE